MDLQIRLANDRYAETCRSPEARWLPAWAVWRDEAYETTFERAVMVYNKRLVSNGDVPQTHSDPRPSTMASLICCKVSARLG
jgi:iron(III) transport system substrate-binding protein